MERILAIETTQQYFKKTLDELLVQRDNGYTREECLLFDEGIEVIFYDTLQEREDDRETLHKYCKSKWYENVIQLLTINERIAVILK